MRARITGLTFLTALACAAPANAQPYAWFVHEARGLLQPNAVAVQNVATGHFEEIEIPAGVTVGAPVVDPSTGRILFITSAGTAQFQSPDPTPLPQLLAWRGDSLVLSPDGLYAYVCTRPQQLLQCSLRRRSDDAELMTYQGIRGVRFDAQGGHLLITQATEPVRSVVSYAGAGAPLQTVWSRTIEGTPLVAVDGLRIVVNAVVAGSGRLLIIDAVTGADVASGDARVGTLLAAGSGRIFVSHGGDQQLQSYDAETLAPLADLNIGGVASTSFFRALYVTGGRLIAQISAIRGGISSRFVVYDAATLTGLPAGGAAVGVFSAAAIPVEPWCEFAVSPLDPTAPTQGGVVEVVVTTSPNCGRWPVFGGGDNSYVSGSAVRTGSGTVSMLVGPNTGNFSRTYQLRVGPYFLDVHQAAETATPDPPSVTGITITGSSATLTWEPAATGPPALTGFVVEGGVAGGPVLQQLNAAGAARSMQLPALPSGTYFVQVRSRNRIGSGSPSPPVRFTIGPASPPEPPASLSASVSGQSVRLSWNAPLAGPAPEFYVVEAAPAGSSAFADVSRTPDGRVGLLVGAVPAGSYAVRVRSANSAGQSAPTAAVVVTVAGCSSPPGVPGPIRTYAAGPVSSTAGFVSLAWDPPASGADRYIIEAQPLSSFGQVGATVTLATNTPATTLDAPAPLGNYLVRVRGANACGTGPPSPDAVVFVPYIF